MKRIATPFVSLLCFLIVANHYKAEWLAWLSIAIFGTIIINELSAKTAGSEAITTGLNLINTKLDLIMTKEERLAQAVADLNAGTNAIAEDLQTLKDQIAAGTVSEESLAALESNIAVLQALGNAQ